MAEGITLHEAIGALLAVRLPVHPLSLFRLFL